MNVLEMVRIMLSHYYFKNVEQKLNWKDTWEDVENPTWNWSLVEYRIKKNES